MSGFCAISFKSAKEGTLNLFAKSSLVTAVKIITIIEALICIAGMAFLMPLTSAFLVLTVVLTVVWYYFKTKKEFGGVTGDTAGYLLLILERNLLFVAVLVSFIFGKFNVIYM